MKKLLCALLSAAMIMCFASCEGLFGLKKYTEYSYDYFDTVTQISGWANSKAEFDEISGFVLSELAEYHRLYDIYFSYDGINNLRDINVVKDGCHTELSVDEKIISLLKYAKGMYSLTDGYMNVAMGSVLSIWHDFREAGLENPDKAELPQMSGLIAASEHTDINDIIIDEENGTVFLSDPEMTLDVGAIAKGYAVECIAQSLEDKGITGYLISVGGNIRTVGARGDGEAWLVGIENPDQSVGSYIAKVGLADVSLVTSGSYQRYYTVDGTRYHHIIDPHTLMPDNYYQSVTVLTKSSALADALSTALFCMDIDAGKALVGSLDGVGALWVMPDGEKVISDGFTKLTASFDE